MIHESVPSNDPALPNYKGVELHELPVGWQWAPFEMAATIESNLVDPFPFGQMPHIAPNHIESSTGRILPYKTISEDGVMSGKHIFQPGQLLYSKIRPYLRKAVVVDFEGLCSADIYPISGYGSSVNYLKYWLLSDDFNSMAAMSQDRTVLPKINQVTLNAIPIPLPPLAEQVRIADKLDALLARVEAGCERLERVPKLLKRFRQSVLSAAVSGELTREWRGGGDAEWEETTVGDIVTVRNGKPFPSSEYSSSGVRLIRPGNLHVSGRVVWNSKNTTHMPKKWADENPDYVLKDKELLMNLTAQSLKDEFLGRVCIKIDPEPALLNQRICAFYSKGPDDVRPYLWILFKSPVFRRFVDTLDSGTLIKHMHSKQVLAYEMRLPEFGEQAEIVRRVESLVCD